MREYTEQMVAESIGEYKPKMKVATLGEVREAHMIQLTDIPKGTTVLAKANGEFTMVKYLRGKDIYAVNDWGRRRRGFHALNELQNSLDKVPGLKSFEGLFECYAYDWERNMPLELPEFIHISKGLGDFSRIRLGAFDMVSMNDESIEDQPFADRFHSLREAVGTKDGFCHLLPHTKINSTKELGEVFKQYVQKDGYEGVVIREPNGGNTFKMKPFMTVDAAIIGLSKEGKTYPQMIRSVKLGIFIANNTIVEIGNVTIADFELARVMIRLKKDMCWEDSKMIYIEPKYVIEVGYTDTFESKNTDYDFDNNMAEIGTIDSVRLKEPRFLRFRKDKGPNIRDCGPNQIGRGQFRRRS